MALARSLMLAQEQRDYLLSLVRRGKTSARAITRAHVLLHCGKGEDAQAIAHRFGLCATTIYDILQRYEEGGLKRALFDRPRPGQPRHFTTQQIQQITALACQKPPTGHAHWTLERKRLLSTVLTRSISMSMVG